MNAHKAAQVLNLPNLLDAKDDAPRLLKLAMRADGRRARVSVPKD